MQVLWPAAKPPKNFPNVGSAGADQGHPMSLRMITPVTYFLLVAVVLVLAARLVFVGDVAFDTTTDFPCVAVATVPVPLLIAAVAVAAAALGVAFPQWPVEPFVAHEPI